MAPPLQGNLTLPLESLTAQIFRSMTQAAINSIKSLMVDPDSAAAAAASTEVPYWRFHVSSILNSLSRLYLSSVLPVLCSRSLLSLVPYPPSLFQETPLKTCAKRSLPDSLQTTPMDETKTPLQDLVMPSCKKKPRTDTAMMNGNVKNPGESDRTLSQSASPLVQSFSITNYPQSAPAKYAYSFAPGFSSDQHFKFGDSHSDKPFQFGAQNPTRESMEPVSPTQHALKNSSPTLGCRKSPNVQQEFQSFSASKLDVKLRPTAAPTIASVDRDSDDGDSPTLSPLLKKNKTPTITKSHARPGMRQEKTTQQQVDPSGDASLTTLEQLASDMSGDDDENTSKENRSMNMSQCSQGYGKQSAQGSHGYGQPSQSYGNLSDMPSEPVFGLARSLFACGQKPDRLSPVLSAASDEDDKDGEADTSPSPEDPIMRADSWPQFGATDGLTYNSNQNTDKQGPSFLSPLGMHRQRQQAQAPAQMYSTNSFLSPTGLRRGLCCVETLQSPISGAARMATGNARNAGFQSPNLLGGMDTLQSSPGNYPGIARFDSNAINFGTVGQVRTEDLRGQFRADSQYGPQDVIAFQPVYLPEMQSGNSDEGCDFVDYSHHFVVKMSSNDGFDEKGNARWLEFVCYPHILPQEQDGLVSPFETVASPVPHRPCRQELETPLSKELADELALRDEVWMAWQRTEKYYAINPTYFCYQSMDVNHRLVIINWIMEVCRDMKLLRQTFQLAVNCLDRFYARTMNINADLHQIFASLAIFIAAKKEVRVHDSVMCHDSVRRWIHRQYAPCWTTAKRHCCRSVNSLRWK